MALRKLHVLYLLLLALAVDSLASSPIEPFGFAADQALQAEQHASGDDTSSNPEHDDAKAARLRTMRRATLVAIAANAFAAWTTAAQASELDSSDRLTRSFATSDLLSYRYWRRDNGIGRSLLI